jgi:hypothetical protein
MEQTSLKAIDPSANQETLRFLGGDCRIFFYILLLNPGISLKFHHPKIQFNFCIPNFLFFFQVVSSIQEVQTCTVYACCALSE